MILYFIQVLSEFQHYKTGVETIKRTHYCCIKILVSHLNISHLNCIYMLYTLSITEPGNIPYPTVEDTRAEY